MTTRGGTNFNLMARGLVNRRAAAGLLLMVLVMAGGTSVSRAAGWQWYDAEPQKSEDDSPRKDVVTAPSAQQNALQKLEMLRQALKASLAEAILYPGTENFIKYFELQNYFTQQAGLFERSAQRAFLEHPELDYNLKHSHYNGTVKSQLAADFAAQRDAISRLAQRYGVMLFYRGAEPIDGQLVGVVKGFRDSYGLSVVPVTVDGVVNPAMPETRRDAGQAQRLGVTHFPALMLVDPRSGAVKPLAYGFISQDDLARQFRDVLTDFKPNY
jgi:conjugal transfer pilus assembly protein TraF